MNLRCAIVDDEYLARQYLCDYVSRVPFLKLTGDYDSPLQVADEINNGNIDLLFLDIQMPDISGLDFLKSINSQPYIIFTTAYSEYALEGYEHNTIDYLLKPFSFERFLKAVNKADEQISGMKKSGKTSDAYVNLGSDFITVRADRRLYRINLDDICFIESCGAYVIFHLKEKKITALFSMKELDLLLPQTAFIRVHKSYIVSINRIESLEGNELVVCGTKIPVGRNYRSGLENIFTNRKNKL